MNDEIFFADRIVTVVGNARSVCPGFLRGAHTIVRCNRIPERGRADILFLDSAPAPKNWGEIKFVHLNCLFPGSRIAAQDLARKQIPFALYSPPPSTELANPTPIFWPRDLAICLGCRPLAGFLAIYRALRLGARELRITGFDFYRQADGRLPERVGPHLIAPHLKQMRAWAYLPHVRIDTTIYKLITPPQKGEKRTN